MKIIVLAGGLSPERDVSLLSGAGICKTLREMGHQAFLLDVFFGLPCDSDKLEEVFDRPDGGLEISKGISTSVPDLDALRKSRPDQSPSEIGPNVIELCQMADITFMALHGSIGENGKLQATFDNLGIKYTGPNSLGCTLSMNKLVTKQIFKTSGVPTPRGTSLTSKTKDTPLDELGYYLPLVVKPCSNGSSIVVYIFTQKKNITMQSTNPSMLTTQTKLSSNHLSRAVNSPAVSLPEKLFRLLRSFQRTDSSTMRTNIRQAALPRSVLLYLSMKRRKN